MTAAASAHCSQKKRGRLTVFASYASGAGKSFAMLHAAEEAARAGKDVVVGLLERGRWPQTDVLAAAFEMLPCKSVVRQEKKVLELDLEVCLQRQPQLMLIDDLSHQNADVSRNRKRYQDIEELLKAGVDVYTTLDVQHIESIQDTFFPFCRRRPMSVFQIEYLTRRHR